MAAVMMAVLVLPSSSRCRTAQAGALLYLLAVSLVLLPAARAQEPGSRLLEDARRWLDAQAPALAARRLPETLDARLQVPTCAEGFEFALSGGGGQAILARCPDSNWSLHLQLEAPQAAGPRFVRQLPAGHLLTEADITWGDNSAAQQDQSRIVGMFLRSATQAGQLVNPATLEPAVTAYVARAAIPAQTTLTAGMFSTEARPASTLPANRAANLAALDGARSTRALAAGTVLTAFDVAARHSVVTAAETLPRGTLVSVTNIDTGFHWGNLPQDVITNAAALPRAVTTTTVAAGTMLRWSTLRLLPPVAKGETVTVLVRRGPLEISQTMRAVQDGQVGQRIDLVNEESGQTVQATVTGVGAARLP